MGRGPGINIAALIRAASAACALIVALASAAPAQEGAGGPGWTGTAKGDLTAAPTGEAVGSGTLDLGSAICYRCQWAEPSAAPNEDRSSKRDFFSRVFLPEAIEPDGGEDYFAGLRYTPGLWVFDGQVAFHPKDTELGGYVFGELSAGALGADGRLLKKLASGGLAQAGLVVGPDAPGRTADTEAAAVIQSSVAGKLSASTGADVAIRYPGEDRGAASLVESVIPYLTPPGGWPLITPADSVLQYLQPPGSVAGNCSDAVMGGDRITFGTRLSFDAESTGTRGGQAAPLPWAGTPDRIWFWEPWMEGLEEEEIDAVLSGDALLNPLFRSSTWRPSLDNPPGTAPTIDWSGTGMLGDPTGGQSGISRFGAGARATFYQEATEITPVVTVDSESAQAGAGYQGIIDRMLERDADVGDPAPSGMDFSTISPRLSLTYDIGGDGKKTFKLARGHYGTAMRFPAQPAGGFAEEPTQPCMGVIVAMRGISGTCPSLSGGAFSSGHAALDALAKRYLGGERPDLRGFMREASGLEGVSFVELDCYRMKQAMPDDPYFYDPAAHEPEKKKKKKKGFGFALKLLGSAARSAGMPVAPAGERPKSDVQDQWGLARVGYASLGGDKPSAWDVSTGAGNPVTVAVIDSGLDFTHPDFSLDNLWVNGGEIPGNLLDDDLNGYVDDTLGWDFVNWNNAPFDDDGHGTLVAGIIAAAANNSRGIAGINWGAKVMVLKVSDSRGRATSFNISKAVIYAVNNGAKVINLSVGGAETTRLEQLAIDYAISKGVVVVAAMGNEGMEAENYSPTSLRGVIAVGGTDLNDGPVKDYNFGRSAFMAAPSYRIFSLRGRRTSTLGMGMLVNYSFGPDRLYYVASGTSFAAPIVAGTVSLMLSRDPSLRPEEVMWALRASAIDVGEKGWDPYTGYGRLDALGALKAGREDMLLGHISGSYRFNDALYIVGTASAQAFEGYRLELGEGRSPSSWQVLAESGKRVLNGFLGKAAADGLRGSKLWTLRLTVRGRGGASGQATYTLLPADYAR